jgi:hypothetical protein
MKIVYEIYSKNGSFCGMNMTDSLESIREIAEVLDKNGQALTITKITKEEANV